jgi:uncharacterized phiE125 gp8 family phage protein
VLALLDAASELAGEASALAWILSSYEATFDDWTSDGLLRLPRGPIVAVESIRLRDELGALVDLDLSAYRAVPHSNLITRPSGADWSLDAYPPGPDRIVVRYTAGFGTEPADVPQRVRAAIKVILAHLYEHRGDDDVADIPPAAEALLAGVRGARYG